MQSRVSGNQEKVYQIDCRIADINAQNLVVSGVLFVFLSCFTHRFAVLYHAKNASFVFTDKRGLFILNREVYWTHNNVELF